MGEKERLTLQLLHVVLDRDPPGGSRLRVRPLVASVRKRRRFGRSGDVGGEVRSVGSGGEDSILGGGGFGEG